MAEPVVTLQSSPLQQETSLRGAWRCPGHFRSVKSGSRVDEHHNTQEKPARQPGQLSWPQKGPQRARPTVSRAGREAGTGPETNPEALMQIQKPKAKPDDPR